MAVLKMGRIILDNIAQRKFLNYCNLLNRGLGKDVEIM